MRVWSLAWEKDGLDAGVETQEDAVKIEIGRELGKPRKWVR